jgi:rod shape determining protein RodA
MVLLICFGLLEIYSIALSQDSLNLLNFKKQVVFIVLGLLSFFILSLVDYHTWRSFSHYFYLGGVLLLVGVLIFGTTIRGTRGWFYIAGLSLQPVEFVKVILIVFLARYFSSFSVKISPVKHLLISGIGSLIFIALVLKQPDFGSAFVLFLVWGIMIAVAGFKKKYLFAIGLFLAAAVLAGWLFFFQDYQKQRILTFLNPSFDPLHQGYNITQAIIAVGSGGLTGRGVGFGSQSQLKFLPEAQNDFIFAVIAEELGFLGIFLVLAFFSIFFYRLLYNLKKVNDDFGAYFIVGCLALIFIEMFINIGMNIGILPVIGISLPFLSYGGSAMFGTLFLAGIAHNVIIRSRMKY